MAMSKQSLINGLRALRDLADSAAWRGHFFPDNPVTRTVASNRRRLMLVWPGSSSRSLYVMNGQGRTEYYLCCERDKIVDLLLPFCRSSTIAEFILESATWCERRVCYNQSPFLRPARFRWFLYPDWRIEAILVEGLELWQGYYPDLFGRGIRPVAASQDEVLVEADPFGLEWLQAYGYDWRPANGQFVASEGQIVPIIEGRPRCQHPLAISNEAGEKGGQNVQS